MAFSILHIVEAALLGGNAMAILNEKRFLRKCKWRTHEISPFSRFIGQTNIRSWS